eukprot:CAMPEP_0176118062 /NCGR_PEP_ID=MMETSP0120_2-20121206/59321_1 /TAXON_ID=160619 /ORGANISM="Kryptoperidinium foliaceum, Strain CCMP 1326" /LENGTH=40 /DNA_ID= /DNA_START= /DNA_END= /DNA_ORIENTATION=
MIASLAANSPASSDNGSPKCGNEPWRLVWCCERSHKAEEE